MTKRRQIEAELSRGELLVEQLASGLKFLRMAFKYEWAERAADTAEDISTSARQLLSIATEIELMALEWHNRSTAGDNS